MAYVKVYTKDPCRYCVAAKELLRERGIDFDEIKMTANDAEAFAALTRKSGMKTVPQIFAGEKLIGGYTELAKLNEQDGLAALKLQSKSV